MIPGLRQAVLQAPPMRESVRTGRHGEQLVELRRQYQRLQVFNSVTHRRAYDPCDFVGACDDKPRGFFPLDRCGLALRAAGSTTAVSRPITLLCRVVAAGAVTAARSAPRMTPTSSSRCCWTAWGLPSGHPRRCRLERLRRSRPAPTASRRTFSRWVTARVLIVRGAAAADTSGACLLLRNHSANSEATWCTSCWAGVAVASTCRHARSHSPA